MRAWCSTPATLAVCGAPLRTPVIITLIENKLLTFSSPLSAVYACRAAYYPCVPRSLLCPIAIVPFFPAPTVGGRASILSFKGARRWRLARLGEVHRARGPSIAGDRKVCRGRRGRNGAGRNPPRGSPQHPRTKRQEALLWCTASS